MFTVLWKIPSGAEEIFCAPYVAKVPAIAAPDTSAEDRAKMDCNGNEHVSFRCFDGRDMVRTVIGSGEVFVMNNAGKTVATYRL